jgi:hypothetical protein
LPSSLNLYFDHVLWINLDRRPDRRVSCEEEFARLRVQAERIPAVDRPGNGVAGCMESHRLLWRRIAAGEFGDRVLIFEDDFALLTATMLEFAGFTPDNPVMRVFKSAVWKPFYEVLPHMLLNERFDAMVEQVPTDWDVFYLGGQYRCEQNVRVAPNVICVGGVLGTLAYGISRAFAARMTEELDRDGAGGPVDLVLSARASTAKHYMLSPRLFIPRPGNTSDVNVEGGRPIVEHFPFAYCDARHEGLV